MKLGNALALNWTDVAIFIVNKQNGLCHRVL